MKNQSRGFSLLEMLVAVSLSAIVLIAIFNVFSSMVRFQIEGSKKSTATGWALASLSKMAKEIEQCTVMPYPDSSAVPSDIFVGCTNWNRVGAFGVGAIDATTAPTVVYYCYDTTSTNPSTGQILYAIRRFVISPAASCPANTASRPVCDGSWALGTNDIVAVDVYRNGGSLLFTKDDAIGGVRVRFVVGKETYTPAVGQPPVVNPQFLKFDTGISLVRSYISSNY